MTQLDVKELSQFLDEAFQIQGYVKSFPLVFSSFNQDFSCHHFENGKLVSFCSLYPVRFPWKQKTLASFCIGSVSTAPSARGKGYAKRVLNDALVKAESLGADFTFLFSHDPLFYEPLGFELCTSEYLFTLNEVFQNKELKAEVTRLEKVGVFRSFEAKFVSNLEALLPDELKNIWKFMSAAAHPSESLISFEELTSLQQLPETTLCLGYKNNVLKSLCFIGKGVDYKNVLHGLSFHDDEFAVALMSQVSKVFEQSNLLATLGPYANSSYFSRFFPARAHHSLMVRASETQDLKTSEVRQAFDKHLLHVRSLHGN